VQKKTKHPEDFFIFLGAFFDAYSLIISSNR